MKRIIFWISLIVILPAAGFAEDATQVITDMVGRKVTAPLDPERIICLGPGALRLIVYLQAAEKVVGVEDLEKRNPNGRPYWIATPKLHKLPRCGPGGPASINKKPDLEAVLQTAPQLIFVTYMEAPLADEIQKMSGIPVVVLSYGSFATFDEAVYDALRIAGTLLNRKERAREVVAYIEDQRKMLQQRTNDIPSDQRAKVYVGGIGYRGTQGIESSEQNYTPFEWINADNLAKQVKAHAQTHVFVNRETLLKLNPAAVFIDSAGLPHVTEDYRKHPRFYQTLKAFSEKKFYTLLPFNWYTTNIGTALCDAFAGGKILYPERFEDVDPEKKADQIYTFMVGKPVYARMKHDYGKIGRAVSFSD